MTAAEMFSEYLDKLALTISNAISAPIWRIDLDAERTFPRHRSQYGQHLSVGSIRRYTDIGGVCNLDMHLSCPRSGGIAMTRQEDSRVYFKTRAPPSSVAILTVMSTWTARQLRNCHQACCAHFVRTKALEAQRSGKERILASHWGMT